MKTHFITIALTFLTFLSFCPHKLKAQDTAFQGFNILNIDEKLENEMRQKNVFNDNSPVPINRLRLLEIKHFGFDTVENNGKIIVLDACSEEALNIFKDLYSIKFPLNKVRLMTEYNSDDSLSMADNNTSGHNLRLIIGGGKLSLHAYGAAIDINPLFNPFVTIDETTGIANYSPKDGIKYANRKSIRLGKPDRLGMAEDVVNIFASHGFYYWGGYWDTPIDYQHFQLSRSLTEILLMMDTETASNFFKQAVTFYNKTKIPIEDKIEAQKDDLGFTNKSISEFYRDNPDSFQAVLRKLLDFK